MKRLYLSKNKKISGVCGGIAEFMNVDATVVRVVTLLLLLLTGIFPIVIFYVIAAFVIPEEPAATVHDVPPTSSTNGPSSNA